MKVKGRCLYRRSVGQKIRPTKQTKGGQEKKVKRRKLAGLLRIYILISAVLSAVSAQATWTETLYSVTQTSNLIAYYPGFTSHESKYYDWGYSVGNHSYCSGSETTDPAWRSEFTPTRHNNWTVNSSTFHVYISDGTSIWAKETYYTKTGTNTFTQGGETASRTLDEHISTNLGYYLQAPGTSPPGDPE